MFVMKSYDREQRLRRIDEAISDWLESQVFPKTRLLSQGGSLQQKNLLMRAPEKVSEVENGLPRFSTDRLAA